MRYRAIAVEAVEAIDALCDYISLSMAGQKIPERDAAKLVSFMISGPRRLRKLIENEDKLARFMDELDEVERQMHIRPRKRYKNRLMRGEAT